MHTQENQNNRYSEELAIKASRLKHIAFDIEQETKEHNQFLQTMHFDFEMARSFLGGTSRYLNYVMYSNRIDRRIMCYVIGAIVFAFLFIYYAVSSFEDQ